MLEGKNLAEFINLVSAMSGSQSLGGPHAKGALLPTDQGSADFFAHGGPFEAFPGAVLMVGHNGIVLAANEQGEPIAELLRAEGLSDLREAVRAALHGAAGQVNPLVLPQIKGAAVSRSFDVLILPWAPGATALLLGRETTLERSLRAALVESRQRYKDLVDLAGAFAWECDFEGRFTFLSRGIVLGYPAKELLGVEAQSLLFKDRDAGPSPFLARDELYDCEVWLKDAEGRGVCLNVTAVPLFDESEGQSGVRGLCRDITLQRQREAEAANARYVERLLSYVLQMVRDQLEPQGMLEAAADALHLAVGARGVAVYRLDPSGVFKVHSRAGEVFPPRLERQILDSLKDDDLTELDSEEGRALLQVSRVNRKANGLIGLWRYGEDEIWRCEERELVAVVASEVAIAIETLAREEELERLSETDALTGLLNRRGFEKHLSARLERRNKRCGALFYIDVDDFKKINDTAGHAAGDQLLERAALLFKALVRSNDIAGRLGGDEFALYLDGVDEGAVEARAKNIQESWNSEFNDGAESEGAGRQAAGFSLGVALLDGETRESSRSLLERADQAMYRVKNNGKGGYCVMPAKSRGRRKE